MSKITKFVLLLSSLFVVLFVVIGSLGVHADSKSDGAYRQLGVYSEVLSRIRTEYVVVNLDRIVSLEETELTIEKSVERGLLKKPTELLKVLANGEVTSAITVHAHKFSKAAQEKIEKAGGKVVVVG